MLEPESAELQLAPGTVLGKYQIIRHLGSGGMGAVYEGVHREIGKSVAIKTLNPVIGAHPAARTRFLREAQLTSRVRHPHIVDITDVGQEGGHAFLVMELLAGEDLSKRLGRQGPFAPEALADIIVPICAAVDTAHSLGVIHRDLKPQNIFLTQGPAGIHPKVLDFGISKNRDLSASALTATGSIVGTPYYLPPELVKDGRAATGASDQYALGVILYECLSGRLPFDGPTIFAIFQSVVSATPTPLSHLRPDIPGELAAIVHQAMHPDAQGRFPSVRHLALALIPFASPWIRFQWEGILSRPAEGGFGGAAPISRFPGNTPFPGTPPPGNFVATTPLPPSAAFPSSPSAPTQLAPVTPAGGAPSLGGQTPAGRVRETAALPAEGLGGGLGGRPFEGRRSPNPAPRPGGMRGRGQSQETDLPWQDVSLKPARSAMPWLVGSLVLAAAGVGAYFLFGRTELPRHVRDVTTRPAETSNNPPPRPRPAELEVKRTPFQLSVEPAEATIEIDGRVLGTGHVDTEIALGRDEHVLRVSAPGYDEKALTFVRELPASPIVLTPSAIRLPDPPPPPRASRPERPPKTPKKPPSHPKTPRAPDDGEFVPIIE
jgi:serine/threonine protein kinase